MYDNIGGKIKTLASTICFIGCVASAIAGIVIFANSISSNANSDTIPARFIIAALITGAGFLISWLSNLCLYAFGQLVENSDKTVELLQKENKEPNPNKSIQDENKPTSSY